MGIFRAINRVFLCYIVTSMLLWYLSAVVKVVKMKKPFLLVVCMCAKVTRLHEATSAASLSEPIPKCTSTLILTKSTRLSKSGVFFNFYTRDLLPLDKPASRDLMTRGKHSRRVRLHFQSTNSAASAHFSSHCVSSVSYAAQSVHAAVCVRVRALLSHILPSLHLLLTCLTRPRRVRGFSSLFFLPFLTLGSPAPPPCQHLLFVH